jgi:hypothetical protein
MTRGPRMCCVCPLAEKNLPEFTPEEAKAGFLPPPAMRKGGY